MQKRNPCSALGRRARPSYVPRAFVENNAYYAIRRLHLTTPLPKKREQPFITLSEWRDRRHLIGNTEGDWSPNSAKNLDPHKRSRPTLASDLTASSDQLSQGSNDAPSGALRFPVKPRRVVAKIQRFFKSENFQSSQLQHISQLKATQNEPRQSQPSQSTPVDATMFGTTRSASHQLAAKRIGQVNNQPNTQSNEFRPTRPGPIDATSLGADPSISSHTVIHRFSEQFRAARRGGRIGTTGGVRPGNFSRNAREEFTSQGNRGRDKGASSRPRRSKKDHQKDLVDHHQELSPEEVAYKQDREAAQRGSPVPFKPEQPTVESLSHMAPALAVSTQGMSEIVLERLRRIDVDRERVVRDVEVLARMKVAGLTPRFENLEQEGLTMQRVEQLLKTQTSHNGDMDVEKEREEGPDGNSKHDIPEVIKNALVQQLVSGSYNMRHPAIDDGRDILGHVGRLANRNGTYRPTDEQSLLRKIQSLLPSARRPPAAVGQRAEATGR